MKKLLLAIFSLISVISYSQTTGYLRYDTVRMQRIGGNSTLVIENATRNNTNAFLQNYSQGRTRFAYALDSVWIDGDSIRFRYGTTTLAVLSPPSYTDADARSAISLTTTGTSGAATYNSETGVFNIPVYAGTLNANAGAFYRWLKPATQEIKTFANGYGIILDSTTNTDAITAILDSATVFPDIRATIEPNLLFDSLGAAGISPITTWNNTIYGRRISLSGGSIDTTASGGLLITVTPGTTLTTTDNNLDITGTVLSTQKTVQTLTDGATITWDMSTAYNAEVTLGGNRTLSITNVQEGDYGTITVFQDGTGGRTLSVPGGTITLNSAISDSTVLSFYYDGNSYAWRDGSKIVLFRAATWANPTSADNITVYKTDVAITVSKVTAVVVGSSPSVTYQINFASDRSSGSPTTLFSSGQVTTSTTTGDEDTTFADATIPAGSYIWITTSAASGTITEMNVTIKYTND